MAGNLDRHNPISLLRYDLVDDPDNISAVNSLLQCAVDMEGEYTLKLLDPDTQEISTVLISSPFTLLEHDAPTNSLAFSCSTALGKLNGHVRLSPDNEVIGKVTIAV